MKHRYLLGTLLLLVVFFLIGSPTTRLESSGANLSSVSNDNHAQPAIAELLDSGAVLTETVQVEEAVGPYMLHLPLIAAGNANGSMTIVVAPDKGGKLVANDGMVTVDVPVGAVASETMISYYPLPNQTVDGFYEPAQQFEFRAVEMTGNEVTQFQEDLTLQVQYNEVAGYDEEALNLYYQGKSEPIGTT